MASRIGYAPALPARLVHALGVWRSGTVIKFEVRYGHSFWRDRGLSGMVVWRDVHGLFACDTSHDDEHPALTVFVGGPLALQWRALGDQGMRAELNSRLVAALGPEAARFPGRQHPRLDRRPLERRRLQRPHHGHGSAERRSGAPRRRGADPVRLVRTVAVISGLCRRRDRRRQDRGCKGDRHDAGATKLGVR